MDNRVYVTRLLKIIHMETFSRGNRDKGITLTSFLNSSDNGIFFCGHASIIVRINQRNFLFDYVSTRSPYGSHWRFVPNQVKIPIDKISAIFVSHFHKDHFDARFLKVASRKVPVYIAGGRESFNKELYNNRIPYTVLDTDSVCEIEKGVFVQTFLHHSNGVDSSFVIGNQNASVYHGNDNYIKNDDLVVDRNFFPRISVACIPYAYINWYPQLLENLSKREKSRESRRLVHHSFEYAIAQALHLSAESVLPFGANLFLVDILRSRLNDECKSPFEFIRYVKKTQGFELSRKFLPALAGDIIFLNSEGKPCRYLTNWTEARYSRVRARLTSKKMLPRVTKAGPLALPNLSVNKPTTNPHIVFVRHNRRAEGVSIRTDTGVVSRGVIGEILKQVYHLTIITIIDQEMFVKWCQNRLKMEWILGTRQFKMRRLPNIYEQEILRFISTEL